MLDYTQELYELSDQKMKVAQEYASERRRFGQLKADIDVIYASRIKNINNVKKNAGYETGLLILISDDSTLRETYKEFVQREQNYKALECILEALTSKITSIQSIMKYNREGEYGNGNDQRYMEK